MKKFVVIAAVMLIGAGAALAASINVPFFLDNSPNPAGFPPGSGNLFFMGLKNTTGASIVVTVAYTTDAGVPSTGPGSTTFSLGPSESISFRPSQDDTSVDTPNAVGIARSTAEAGGATFTWTGATTDIQGRGVQLNNSGLGSFAFLLPPGV